MLHVVRSPLPGSRFVPANLPTDLAAILARLRAQPERCHWVLPTGRLRRAVQRGWLADNSRAPTVREGESIKQAGSPSLTVVARQGLAALLPNLHTLERFVAWALEYSLCQRPGIDGVERIFRIANAWHEASGGPAGPGHLAQLDRFVRDWQACGLPPKKHSSDPFDKTAHLFLQGLEKDRRFDRMSSIAALTQELADHKSCLCRLLLAKTSLILFDGFHRLEGIELELIATVAKHCDVLLWLVGTPGQTSARTIDEATRELSSRFPKLKPWTIDAPSKPDSFTFLGRRLFPLDRSQFVKQSLPPGLFRLQPRSATEELESVAACIKADYRSARSSDHPLRLSDIAVVLPGGSYDPLVREVFPRHGLEFNLAGRALGLAASRPARLIHAALEVIRGQWRYDLLLDFLQHPLVLRRIEHAERLHNLFDRRPRARRRLDCALWTAAWDDLIGGREEQLRRYETGSAPLPDHITTSREEYMTREREKLTPLRSLIESLRTMLKPVAEMDELIEGNDPEALRKLVECCAELLQLVEIDQWLAPFGAARHKGGPAVPWVEYEKDQQSYSKLLAVLESLAALPAERLPKTDDGRPDALTALLLALDSESYQIKTEDDAGVQLFELREIRGQRFRHIYVLGLLDGQLPALPEEGTLVTRRRHIDALRTQLEQKEEETQHLFTQVFEAATERLVLSQPQMSDGQKTLPSSFLSAVTRHGQIPPLHLPKLVASLAAAGQQVGRLERHGPGHLVWPADVGLNAFPRLRQIQDDLGVWRSRAGLPQIIRVDLPALLRVLFPDERPFSASDLETYAACPFRYFGQRILGLAEREPDPGRQRYGSLVHRVFQGFYDELRRGSQVPADQPLPPIDAGSLDHLRDLFEQEWRKEDEGMLAPELRHLFMDSGGVLDLFLAVIRDVETERGNLLNEYVLGAGPGQGIVIGTDVQGRPVAISGKIDRVDARRDRPEEAALFDYKTGSPFKPKTVAEKAGDGRMIQLPLYAATLRASGRDLQVTGGYYVHLSERAHRSAREAREMLVEVRQRPADAAPEVEGAFDPEAARRLALQFAGQIRTGEFPLTEHPDGDTCECNGFCSLRHACRQPLGYEAE